MNPPLNSPRPARVAVLGCGAITERCHAPALRTLVAAGEVDVSHLFDVDPARVRQIQAFLPQARPLDNLEALASMRPELVLVASPVKFHALHAITALRAGAAVLCEKPMAKDAAEAEAMIDAATATGRPLAIGLCRRFLPAAQEIHRLLQTGLLGRVRRVRAQEGGKFNWPAQSPAFFSRETGGGGVLIDAGVHLLDLLLWWFGEPESIDYRDDAAGGVEANCLARLAFTGVPSVELRLSRDTSLKPFVRIEGDHASLDWNALCPDRLLLRTAGSPQAWQVTLTPSAPSSPPLPTFEGIFIEQIRNGIAAARGQAPLLVPGIEGIRSLRLIDQCYRQRQAWSMPWYEATEQAVANRLAHAAHP
jgi:predicted dehydrogenase